MSLNLGREDFDVLVMQLAEPEESLSAVRESSNFLNEPVSAGIEDDHGEVAAGIGEFEELEASLVSA